MGVKSTVHISRRRAIARAVELEKTKREREIEALFTVMSDKELESALERMNDAQSPDGEGFENYIICED